MSGVSGGRPGLSRNGLIGTIFTLRGDKRPRELAPLDVGAKVFVQNQHGNHPLIWDKTGTVVELT